MHLRLFEAFNMSSYLAKHAQHGMTWQELMQIRLEWNEVTKDLRLADWENKLGMKAIWQYYDLPSAEVYFSLDKQDFLVSALRARCKQLIYEGDSFVIKPSHLCASQGIYIYEGDQFKTADVFSPIASSSAIDSTEFSLDAIMQNLEDSLESCCSHREAWSLRNSKPGVIVEKYLPFNADLRVMTLFGEVQAASLAGARAYLDKQGRIFGYDAAQFQWLESIWFELVAIAEQAAQHTDMLRLDFFVSETGGIYLNEMCTFVWPEATTFEPFLDDFAKLFVKTYLTKPIEVLPRTFARVH